MTAVAPSASALSILRRSFPGTKRIVRSGGAIPGENTSDFRSVRTSAAPDARTTGGAWSVALCSLAMAAGSYATLGFAPLAPLIREEFSLTRWQVGAITAIVFGGAAISSVPGGRLTDRFGAPPMLAAAVACVAGGCVLAATAPGGRLLPARRRRRGTGLRPDHAAHERDRARRADDAPPQPAHEREAGRRDDRRLRLGRHDADDRAPRRLAARAARSRRRLLGGRALGAAQPRAPSG